MDDKVIVRGSAEHKYYIRHGFGWIKEAVNSFETRIAVSGRVMLLLYVVYITVKATLGSQLDLLPPIALTLIDALMITMQVLGLEGSVPGLIHLSEELDQKNRPNEAKQVRWSATVAQFLVVATAGDIVLQHTPVIMGIAIGGLATVYSNVLFVLRVIIIGMYLIAMARLEHQGPKIISEFEAAKKKDEDQQRQILIDNTTIMDAVARYFEQRATPAMNGLSASINAQLQQVLDQFSTQQITLQSEMEGLRIASGQSLALSEIARLTQEAEMRLTQTVDAKMAASLPDLNDLTQWLTQQVLRQADAKLLASDAKADALTQRLTQLVDAKLASASEDLRQGLTQLVDAKLASGDLRQTQATPRRQFVPRTRLEPVSDGSTSESDSGKINSIGMSKEDVLAEFEKDPSLLLLANRTVSDELRKRIERCPSEATVRRAKEQWNLLHSENKVVNA